MRATAITQSRRAIREEVRYGSSTRDPKPTRCQYTSPWRITPAIPTCTGERFRQRMEGGPTIARSPMPVMEEPEGIGDEFKRR